MKADPGVARVPSSAGGCVSDCSTPARGCMTGGLPGGKLCLLPCGRGGRLVTDLLLGGVVLLTQARGRRLQFRQFRIRPSLGVDKLVLQRACWGSRRGHRGNRAGAPHSRPAARGTTASAWSGSEQASMPAACHERGFLALPESGARRSMQVSEVAMLSHGNAWPVGARVVTYE